MSDMKTRVERVVAELCALQRDLNQQLMDSAEPGAVTGQAATPPAAAETAPIRDLKSVVDQVRHFLWFYLQVSSAGSESAERTRQLLRQVARDSHRNGQENPATFFERLSAMAEYAVLQRNRSNSKPN
ncbi:MAG TPA: hypothetical protein VFA60_10785 [Terriglobales bacterium]|nr:hypothetical protein [Terriglobales bacterium]